jgi:hypothetical protein
MPYHAAGPDQRPSGLACGTPYQTLPDRMLAVRTHWWFWFGPGSAYQVLPTDPSGSASILLHYYQSLPAAGLNTHNDRNSHILYSDSGPTRIRLISQASDQKEIAPPHPHDPQSHTVREPAILTPRPAQYGRTTANTRAKQTILVKIS